MFFFIFFYKESKYNENNSGEWEGRGWGVVARVNDFFRKYPSLKKIEGVKVREDWLL